MFTKLCYIITEHGGHGGEDCGFVSIMRIVIWNVRGIGQSEKRRAIKEAITESRCDVVITQKSKISKPSTDFLRSLEGAKLDEWEGLDADEAAGGILVGWNSRKFIYRQSIKGEFFVTVELWCLPVNQSLWFSTVYGSCDRCIRGAFFNEIEILK